MRIEAQVLMEEARHAPAHVPAVHHYSPAMALIVMDYLAPPHIMLRNGLIAGHSYPRLGAHMANFLARTLFPTSLFALDSAQYRCGTTPCQAFHSEALLRQRGHARASCPSRQVHSKSSSQQLETTESGHARFHGIVLSFDLP